MSTPRVAGVCGGRCVRPGAALAVPLAQPRWGCHPQPALGGRGWSSGTMLSRCLYLGTVRALPGPRPLLAAGHDATGYLRTRSRAWFRGTVGLRPMLCQRVPLGRGLQVLHLLRPLGPFALRAGVLRVLVRWVEIRGRLWCPLRPPPRLQGVVVQVPPQVRAWGPAPAPIAFPPPPLRLAV